MKIVFNRAHRVIPVRNRRGYGYSSLGFQVAFDRATAVAKWLAERGVGVDFPREASIGMVRGYRE